ncbi:MAG: TlpA family protein disulfide reductase [Anaerolineales bacterium]|jgi:peroxiredoxin|nr:TlpA family protein disulfide reductase [Anaerolineales bacterium]
MRRKQISIDLLLGGLVLILGLAWIGLNRADALEVTHGGIPAPRQGFQAPDFELPNTGGEMVRITGLRGKPVMLNVWASWCGPCRAEMPAMQRVYETYQSQGLEILAVNSTSQDTRQDALAFAESLGLRFPILFDDEGQVARLYQVNALPTTFFIDAQGIIQDVIIGGPMAEALLRVRVEQILTAQSETGR